MKKIGDIKEHDDDEDTSEMGEDKEALNTENWNLESGKLEEELKLVWNRQPENNFVLVVIFI